MKMRGNEGNPIKTWITCVKTEEGSLWQFFCWKATKPS